MKKFRRNNYSQQSSVRWEIPLIDFFVLMFLTSFIIWVASLALVNKPQTIQTIQITNNADFIIPAQWDKKEDCDVDVWVKTPTGSYVSFQHHDQDFVTIDRDAKGFTADTMTGPDNKSYTYESNEEIVYIRKAIPGEYTINVHLYVCHNPSPTSMNHGDPKELSVNLEMFKMKPNVKSIFTKQVTFKQVWQEITVVHFKIDDLGNYTYLDDNQQEIALDTRNKASSGLGGMY